MLTSSSDSTTVLCFLLVLLVLVDFTLFPVFFLRTADFVAATTLALLSAAAPTFLGAVVVTGRLFRDPEGFLLAELSRR
ncbi:hypothetical protein K438DRAFT_1817910 [Mycena galopus ATCC 62051]|nr:hypothetical protein K438DRAFT_1817910 [Mycena galopus ATCC 62051]